MTPPLNNYPHRPFIPANYTDRIHRNNEKVAPEGNWNLSKPKDGSPVRPKSTNDQMLKLSETVMNNAFNNPTVNTGANVSHTDGRDLTSEQRSGIWY